MNTKNKTMYKIQPAIKEQMMIKMSMIFFFLFSINIANAQSLDDAIQMYKYERYQSAKNILQNLSASNPLANYYLGLCELNDENIGTARNIFEKYPDDAANMAGIARVLFTEKKVPEANAMLNKVVAKAKKKDMAPYKYAADAITYTDGGDPNMAVEWYKKAMEIEKTGELYLGLGDVYRKIQGGGGSAMNNYEYAETYPNTKAMATLKMGNLWYAARNYDSALALYARTSSLDPKNPLPFNELANAYNKIAKYNKAKENIEKYLPLSDNTIDDQIRYANVLYLSKNYNEAIAKMNELINKGAEKPYMYRVIGFSQYELKQYKEAEISMNKFFSKQVLNKIIPLDYYYIGKILLKDSTKRAQAFEQFEKGLQLDTVADKSSTIRTIAEAYFEAEDYAGSAVWYKKLAESNYPGKEDRDYWWAGYMSFYAADYINSEKMFIEYNKINPTEPLGVLWMARLNEKAKDKDYKNGIASEYYTKWLGMIDVNDAQKKKDLLKAYTYLAMVAYNNNKKEETSKYTDLILGLDPNHDTGTQLKKAIPSMK